MEYHSFPPRTLQDHHSPSSQKVRMNVPGVHSFTCDRDITAYPVHHKRNAWGMALSHRMYFTLFSIHSPLCGPWRSHCCAVPLHDCNKNRKSRGSNTKTVLGR